MKSGHEWSGSYNTRLDEELKTEMYGVKKIWSEVFVIVLHVCETKQQLLNATNKQTPQLRNDKRLYSTKPNFKHTTTIKHKLQL